MKSTKLKSVLAIILIMCTLSGLDVKATEMVDNNLEYKSVIECNKFIGNLVDAIVDKDAEFMYNNVSYFENNCYESLKQYLLTNKIADSKYTISNIIIDVTYPENSSTGDTVIMANTKIWYDDSRYNKLYLFEFHVNAIGDIYGFNVWVY